MNVIVEYILIALAIIAALGFILRRIYTAVHRGKVSCCAACNGCAGCNDQKTVKNRKSSGA